MGTLVVAYVVGWVAVTSYVIWLGIQNRHLTQRINKLDAALESQTNSRRSRAA
jgi:uncharacterized membrane protein YciS (DUF1049 family)